MRRYTFVIIMALCATLFSGIAVAASIPQSSCTVFTDPISGPSFTCDLYPSDASGNFNGQVTTPLPPASLIDDPLTPGFMILVKPGSDLTSGFDSNRADWTQVLAFDDNGFGQATALTLYTLGCNNGNNASDNSCFPALTALDASGGSFFEPRSGIFVYTPGDFSQHEYTLHFLAQPAPEPASAGLFGMGVFAILLTTAARRNRRRTLHS
jgi:hypothetical protein